MTQQQIGQFAKQASRIPFSEGLHWVATKGDQAIHVVGTMHNGDQRLNRVMRSVAPYVRKADVVFVETHGREAEKESKNIFQAGSPIFLPRPPYLDQLLKPALWKQVEIRSTFMQEGGEHINRVQPIFLAIAMFPSDCNPNGWQSKKRGFDEKIERLAHRKRIPVMAFETFETGMQAVTSIPLRDQVKMLELEMRSTTRSGNTAITVRNAYFEEKLTLGMLIADQYSYQNAPVSRQEAKRLNQVFLTYLLDRRNKNWLPILLKRKEQTIFVAVGAAHLPGKNGLLNMLKSRGFKLRNLPL